MNRRARTLHRSSKNRPETAYRYLKPGALAQIRNSRMIARFNRFKSTSLIQSGRSPLSPPSTPMDSGLFQATMIDGPPCFSGRVYGPVCQQRKRLLASKSTCFIGLTSFNSAPDLPSDPTMDVSVVDIVAAH